MLLLLIINIVMTQVIQVCRKNTALVSLNVSFFIIKPNRYKKATTLTLSRNVIT